MFDEVKAVVWDVLRWTVLLSGAAWAGMWIAERWTAPVQNPPATIELKRIERSK